jgi:hypothetical protein
MNHLQKRASSSSAPLFSGCYLYIWFETTNIRKEMRRVLEGEEIPFET